MALTKEQQKAVEETVEKYKLANQGINIRNSEGDIVGNVERGTNGIYDSGQAVYQMANGEWTADPVDVAHFTLTEDGAVLLTAPKFLYETPEFAQIFNADTITSYSAAYRTDPNVRVPYTQLNEDGTTEETQLTIPEFVDKLNEGLANFISNYRNAEAIKKDWARKYGDKVNNLSLTQVSLIENSNAKADRVLIPDVIFNFDNDLADLESLRDEDGTVSTEDFMKVYTRSNLDQEELAGIMAALEGYLRGSEWGAEEITYENGETVKNANSASQATAALALKNFILSKDPNSEWWQSAGDTIVTLIANFGKTFNDVFVLNPATFIEGFVPGEHTSIQNYTEEVDEAFSTWNQERALIQDSTAAVSLLGQIGGMIGGTLAQGVVLGAATEGISSAYAGALAKSAAQAGLSQSAYSAFTMSSLLNLENVKLGARIVLATAPAVQKVAWGVGIYKMFMSTHKALDWATSLLLDTMHDAIVFDGPTLRRVLEGSDDQNVKNYWLSQLADNSKWWVGTAVARNAMKFAGKTAFGQLVNAKLSQFINKTMATVGDKKQLLKDYIYGGDVVRHLQNQIDKLPEGSNKRRRLVNKLQQTQLNEQLRKARRALADVELERVGLIKLSQESLEKYRSAADSIRQIENAIDHYNQSAIWKQMEMVGTVKDPATGNRIYVNPDLGVANAKATKVYQDLLDLTQKYHLSLGENSKLGQLLIDYLVGKQDLKIKNAIANAGGSKAAEALADAEVISDNLAKVRSQLPNEVVNYIDKAETLESYTAFYFQLNRYGESKGLIDVPTIKSYESNPIWANNGYMPVEKEIDVSGEWVPADGRYTALIQNDIEHLTFNTKPGQHYVDPELVRQQRLNALAKTEINAELYQAYRSIESATNKNILTGEETARAKTYKGNKRKLEKAVDNYIKNASDDVLVVAQAQKRRRPIKNESFDEAMRSEIVASFSLSETTQILQEKRVLTKGSRHLSDGVSADNYTDWFNDQSKPVQDYLIQTYIDNGYISGPESGINNFDLFRKAVANGADDFEAGLQRAYLIGDEAFGKSSVINRAAENLTNGKAAFQDGYIVESAKGYLKNVQGIVVDEFVDEVVANVRKVVDNYVNNVLGDAEIASIVKTISSDSGNGASLTGKYIALQRLAKNKQAQEKFWNEVEKSLKNKGLSYDNVLAVKRQTERIWDDCIKSQLNDTAQALRTINPDLVDNSSIYKEVSELVNDLKGSQEQMNENTIMYLDSNGQQVYAEVDPNFASLYNYRYRMTRTEAGAMAKFNAVTSKLFRYGTTTLNLKSFGNQLFRDTGNALFVGGAWDTIKHNADNMVDVFGQDVVDQIKRFDPTGYEIRQVEKIAEQTGQTMEEAAVSRELARGAAVSPATTETVLYRQFMREAYGTDTLLTNLQDRLDGVIEKFDPDKLLNGKRENYLRNRVYANNLNRALSEGYNLEQARTFATFAMNNATTNFSRQLYHMQAISDSTPYFRAAINGTKSFWRMWSLDPVGISGRIMGGLILPAMYLTGASVGTEENRKVYKNIPEYQKADSLIFVVDKQVVSIPIPQEIANIVAPYRQFVEYLYTANENDFWELMMNDALGFSPVDLTAFTTIDMDKMIQDPTLKDRIDRGFARVFSTMAPVPVKTAYMLATGTDPYSGKKLNDPSYTYWNDATNSFETMDYSQNSFAKAVADAYGKASGNEKSSFASPAVLEKVVSGVLGSTGSTVLGSITAIFTKNMEAGLAEFGSGVAEQVSSPFYSEIYNQADSVWKRAVRSLEAEKEQIIASEKYQVVYKKLAQTTDEEARKKLMAEGQNLIKDYQNKVAQTVERLDKVYEGTFDRQKFAAVIGLLNFNSDAVYQSGTVDSSSNASDVFYEGKNAAIATMEALGVDGTSDMSIFGYLITDAQGNSVMKYAEPTAIMEMRNVWLGASDIDVANVEAKLKADGIKRGEMWDGYYAAKAQGKDALKQYKSAWNARVVKSLAPYISERGVESVLRNSQTRDILDNYLFIDNLYQTKQYLYKIFGES